MGFIGQYQPYYAQILFVAFAVISSMLFVIQIVKLQKLKILPIYLLPFLSFLVCYQNSILYYSDNISSDSGAAYAGYVFHSLEIPLYIIIIYEVAQRLHEARSAKFFFLLFDEELKFTNINAIVSLWVIRFIATGLFVLNILTNFSLIPNETPLIGSGGYMYLAENKYSLSLWLNLIPPIVLSFISITVGIVLFRYGRDYTLSVYHTRRWRLILLCALCQAVGQIFNVDVYAVTSNAGELALLCGLTLLVKMVQDDLSVAGAFADFLYESNTAFNRAGEQQIAEQAQEGQGHHHHHHSHYSHDVMDHGEAGGVGAESELSIDSMGMVVTCLSREREIEMVERVTSRTCTVLMGAEEGDRDRGKDNTRTIEIEIDSEEVVSLAFKD